MIRTSNILIYLSLFFLFWGVRSIGNGYFYRGGLNPPKFSELKPIYGTIEKISMGRSWGISVTDNTTGKKYTSGIESCGYPELKNDLNKSAKILIGNGKIYQIEVDGNITKSYLNRIASDEHNINFGIRNILIGAIILSVGVFVKIRNRRKS